MTRIGEGISSCFPCVSIRVIRGPSGFPRFNLDNSEEPRISRITRMNQNRSETAMRAVCAPQKNMESIISNFQH